VWQTLHSEIEGRGATVVTVALDVNPDHARPWIAATSPTHPSLIDTGHVTDRLFGFTNVPMAVWIDESGTIVRPAELFSIEPNPLRDAEIPDDLPPLVHGALTEVQKFQGDPEAYRAAIEDWIGKGSDSRFALSPDEVVERSAARPIEHSRAAAYFELGQRRWSAGDTEGAVPFWREAHRLQPENWTYKRQAWTFVTTPEGEPPDLLQGPNDVYEGSWLADLRAQGGGETYYSAPRLD